MFIEENEKELIELLKKVPMEMSDELYNAFARVRPQPAIEVVILKIIKNETHVLLIERSFKDKYWPNMWHSPGTILRYGESISMAFKRLSEKELFFSFWEKPQFVNWRNSVEAKRGHEISLIFRYDVGKNFSPPTGKFFPVDDLPESILPHHCGENGVIKIALKGEKHVY